MLQAYHCHTIVVSFWSTQITNCWMGTEKEEEVVPKNKHHAVPLVPSRPISGFWGGVWSWHQTRKPCGDLAFSRKRRWRNRTWSVGRSDIIYLLNCCSLIGMIYHDIVIVPIGTQWSLSPYVPKLFHWRILPSKVFKVSCFMFLAASGVPCLLPSTQHCSESQVRAKRRCWTGKMLLMLAGPTETMAESFKHCRTCVWHNQVWVAFKSLPAFCMQFQNPTQAH